LPKHGLLLLLLLIPMTPFFTRSPCRLPTPGPPAGRHRRKREPATQDYRRTARFTAAAGPALPCPCLPPQ